MINEKLKKRILKNLIADLIALQSAINSSGLTSDEYIDTLLDDEEELMQMVDGIICAYKG